MSMRPHMGEPMDIPPPPAPEDHQQTIPTHNCEIQGPGTPMIRTRNITTGELSDWTCIWCELAKHFRMRSQ